MGGPPRNPWTTCSAPAARVLSRRCVRIWPGRPRRTASPRRLSRDLADRDALAGLLDDLDLAAEHAPVAARTRREALAILDSVLSLRRTDPGQADFAPLRECQARAGQRHEAIAASRPRDLPDDVAALANKCIRSPPS